MLAREPRHRYVDPEPPGQSDGVVEVLLAQGPHVVEDPEPAVVRGDRRGGGAVHDRARPAGDRVGVPDHAAQVDQVDAGRLGQPLRLTRGGERDEVQEVAGQLGGRARPDRAAVDDLAAQQRERLGARRERLIVTADQDRQRAVVGTHGPAAHGGVDDPHPRGCGQLRQARREVGRDGRVDRDGRADAGPHEELGHHVAHLVVVADHHPTPGRTPRRPRRRCRRPSPRLPRARPAGPGRRRTRRGRRATRRAGAPSACRCCRARRSRGWSPEHLPAVDVDDLAGQPGRLVG